MQNNEITLPEELYSVLADFLNKKKRKDGTIHWTTQTFSPTSVKRCRANLLTFGAFYIPEFGIG